MAGPDGGDKRPTNTVAVITLLALGVIALIGWLAYPSVQRYVSFQDCVGTGRANCEIPAR